MKKIYTNEFKEMAVDLSYNSDKPITLLSKELGVSEAAIYRWRNTMNPKSEVKDHQELRELKKKLAKLEVENEILKKALAICNRN
ncbi:MAG: transposase [Leptospiraceae bacterium]|nr:transposase [Leptospiraceae bacterium]